MGIGLIANSKRIEKKEYSTQKISQSIAVDGLLDEPGWETALWSGDFQMYYPYDNKKPSEPTSFAMLYDENYLYVGIKAHDSEPDKISKQLTRRDNLDGDYVDIQIDSYDDLQTAYCFVVSAAGTKRDVFISSDGDSSDDSWDPIWWVKTAITKDGWEAEMKIPFSQLRFVNKNDQTWGIQVERYIKRDEETSLWQPKERTAPGWVHHYGKMNGLEQIKPRKAFDLYPYTVGSYEHYEKDQSDPFLPGKEWHGNLGLDGKIGLTNNLTLDFTINPDFGQVEADPSTVNLSGFELFFQEKRPFFIEGSNIINFPLMFGDGNLASENLFYSRRIGRNPQYSPDLGDNEYARIPSYTKIIGATKLTGRTQNGLSIGIMESVTAEENAKIRLNNSETRHQTVEPLTNYSVISLQKDFGKGNTLLNGIVTSTNRKLNDPHLDFLHKNAYTGGLEFTKYWADKTWLFTAKTSFSHVMGSSEAITNTQESSVHLFQRPDANHVNYDTTRTSLTGTAGNIYFGRVGGDNLHFLGAVYFKSPEYEINDIGFVRHVDDIIQIYWMGYRFTKPFFAFKNANLNFNQWSSFDYGGTFLGIGGNINGFATFTNNYSIGTGINYNGQELSTTQLRGGPSYLIPGNTNSWVSLETDSRKKIYGATNFSFSQGFEHNMNSQYYGLDITAKPHKTVQLTLSPAYTQSFDEQQYVAEADFDATMRYILATINQKVISLSLRLNWNITPDISVQYWGQPFFATGKYSNYKYVTNNTNSVYTNRFQQYNSNQVHVNSDDELVEIDETENGVMDYSFDLPDFNSKVFLSNLVLRYEYLPGSVLFFVWSQNRNDFTTIPTHPFNKNVDELIDVTPHNTFLIKLSYRIGI